MVLEKVAQSLVDFFGRRRVSALNVLVPERLGRYNLYEMVEAFITEETVE